jgi:hypothetical protein
MGVSVALSDVSLDVVPGEEVVCTATVRNTGPVIDQINFDVVGPAAAWAVIEPPMLNLYPGDSGEVRVHFRPPRASSPAAGPVPYGLRATSLEDPRGSATEEGAVIVAPFTDLRITLLPQISRGGRRGRHKIDVANLGNVPVGTEISAVDPDDALTFDVHRPAIVAPPGLVTQTRLVAVPRQKFWTGKQQVRPFQVVVQPERGTANTVDGTFEQDPLIPKWVVAGAVAALVLAVVLAGLWFGLVRPAIKSAATEAATKQSDKIQAAQAQKTAADAKAAEDQKAKDALAGTAAPKPAVTKPPAPGTPGNPLTTPFDFRIQTDTAAQTVGFKKFTSPKQGDKPLDVTDLQLQNPAGDVGLLEIRRGDLVVYSAGLENFRDLPNPSVSALRFAKGQKLVVAIQCRNPAPESRRCSAAVTVIGKTV